MTTKIIDLDKEFGFDAATPVTTRPVTLLGMTVNVVMDLNSFGLMQVTGSNTTTDDVIQFFRSMVDPTDWPQLQAAIAQSPAFRGEDGAEKLMALVRRLMEVASDPFPTKQPSDLRRTDSTQSTVRKSPAGSGSARGKASTTSR